MAGTQHSRAVFVVVVTLLIMAGQSCGSDERSAGAFCGTLQDQIVALVERYDNIATAVEADADPLSGLLLAAATLTETHEDLLTLGDRLEASAPEEIAPAVADVQDGIGDIVQAHREGGTVGALAQFTLSGPAVADSAVRIDRYIREHCDLSLVTG